MTKIKICYCGPCGYRAMAEGYSLFLSGLLKKFGGKDSEVELVDIGGGNFDVYLDNVLVFSKSADGNFPIPQKLWENLERFLATAS